MSDDDRALAGQGRRNAPASGLPSNDWDDEPTGVGTDAQVFRAVKGLGADVKALGSELVANKLEAARAHGALKQELGEFKTTVDTRLTKQDLVLERMAGQMDVLVPMARKRTPSAEIDARIEKHEKQSSTKFRRDLAMKIVGGVCSSAVLGGLIHWWLS